jgi:hypothetical protein
LRFGSTVITVTVLKHLMMVSAIQPEGHAAVEISIRPVAIPGDIRWLHQWTGISADCLTVFYESIAASSFIQSLMVWENEQPVLQVDICEAVFDDLGAGDAIAPGDYTMRLQFSPHALHNSIWRALYNCLDYVFLQKKASRILIAVDKSNQLLQEWVKDARFTLSGSTMNKRLHSLYMLTKAS